MLCGNITSRRQIDELKGRDDMTWTITDRGEVLLVTGKTLEFQTLLGTFRLGDLDFWWARGNARSCRWLGWLNGPARRRNNHVDAGRSVYTALFRTFVR